MQRPLRIGIAVLIAAVAAFALTQVSRARDVREAPAKAAAAPAARATRGAFPVRLKVQGELVALRQATVFSRWWGKIQELAEEGKAVKKGDILGKIESEKFERNMQNDEIDLAVYQKQIEQLQRDLDAETKNVTRDLKSAQDKQEVARLQRERIASGSTPAQRADAKAALECSQIAARARKEEFERLAPLAEKGFATREELESRRVDSLLADRDLEKTRISTQRILAQPDPIDLEKADLALVLSGIANDLQRVDCDSRIAALRQQIAGAQSRIDQIYQWNRENKMAIDNCTFIAPSDGFVVYRKIQGRDKIKVGQFVWQGLGIIDIPDLSFMKVDSVKIPETRIRSVKIGDAVLVRVDTVPDRIYRGRIVWIDSWAHDKNTYEDSATREQQGLSGAKVFEASVEVLESDPRLKLGFKAEVEFTFEEIPDAVTVPETALQTDGAAPYVLVRTPAGVRPMTVKVGASSDGRVQILDGLSGGEEVVLKTEKSGE